MGTWLAKLKPAYLMKEKEGNSLTKVQTVAWEQLFRKQGKRRWPVPRTGSGAVRAPSVGLEDSITRRRLCTHLKRRAQKAGGRRTALP